MPSLRHDPVRTCVGCREEAGKRGLIRLVRGPVPDELWAELAAGR